MKTSLGEPKAMPRPSSKAMEADVMQMEQRLAELKVNMSRERERRDAQRQKNPTGSVWKSARADAPVNSAAYAEKVLKDVRQPTPPSGAAPACSPGPQKNSSCPQRYRWHLEKNATQMPAVSWRLTM